VQEIQEIISIPNILLVKKVGFDSSMRMAKDIVDIYPDQIKASPFEVIVSGNITRYQRKLVSVEKFEDFNRIVGLEKIIKSCHFMIGNKLINYSNIRFRSNLFWKLFL
jgi:hypothetical protein